MIDFVDRDDRLDFIEKWRDEPGSEDHHPDCGDYGECACGPCERCDEDGMVDHDVPDPDIGWRAVYQTCPTCEGSKIDPEARA